MRRIFVECEKYAALLRECGRRKSLAEGRRLHSLLTQLGLDYDRFVGNHLVKMYGDCGSIDEVRLAFEKIEQPNVYSWTILIKAYAENGHTVEARNAFDRLEDKNAVSWNTMLSAYLRNGDLGEAKMLFDEMPNPDIASWNTIVTAYARLANLDEAKTIFDKMPQRNVVSWNTMITASAQQGFSENALALFHRLPQRTILTWASVISSCVEHDHVLEAKALFEEIPELDLVSCNAMIIAYMKLGHLESAKSLFGMMPVRNVVPWTSMILAFARTGNLMKARSMFDQMPEWDVIACNTMVAAYTQWGRLEDAKNMFDKICHRSPASWTALLTGYGNHGDLKQARALFDESPHPNLVSWNGMITAYAHSQQGTEAIDLFRLMCLEGVQPNSITFCSAIDACAEIAALPLARIIHDVIPANDEVLLGNAIITMYGKCGSLDDAKKQFQNMNNRDVVSWTAIMVAYARNGQSKEALDMFPSMILEGVEIDDVAFMDILSACSHNGLYDDGWSLFASMNQDFGVRPKRDHYMRVIDLLSRSGQLKEAEDLIDNMTVEPDITAWNTLLSACKVHGYIEGAYRAADKILELNPEKATPYLLLSSMYATALKIS